MYRLVYETANVGETLYESTYILVFKGYDSAVTSTIIFKTGTRRKRWVDFEEEPHQTIMDSSQNWLDFRLGLRGDVMELQLVYKYF